MKDRLWHILFTILFLIFGPQAAAQSIPGPAVLPAQLEGAGSPYKQGETPEGYWLAWNHTRGTTTTLYVVCMKRGYQIVHPETSQLKTPNAVLRAYWQANATRDCKTDPELRPMFDAAKAAFKPE